MSFVRTVLGDIVSGELGVCYAHEHVIIDPSFTTQATPAFLLDNVARATTELLQFRANGGQAMIDSMPCDAGRNVVKLAVVSRATGVHLVAPTGLHLAQYYDLGHWGNFYTVEQLAGLFVADINDGIDEHDYSGPLVKRTPHRAGVIKIATGTAFTKRDANIFAAAAEAHRRTGAPILTHTEQGTLGLEQVVRLRDLGVDLRHVCISHLDRKPDLAYHRDILASGVRVEYDSGFRWPAGRRNPTLELVMALLPEFPGQIMLGMDAARWTYWRSYGGQPGLSFLLKDFSEQLRERGLTGAQWQQMFVATPAATYAFHPNPAS